MLASRMGEAFAVAVSLALVVGCGSGYKNTSTSTVLLTGCLRPGDQPNAFLLDAVGSPNAAVATKGGPQTSEMANPTGTAARSASSDIGSATTQLYTLKGDKKVDLSPYEGSVVQVRGRIERENHPTAGPAGKSQPEGAGHTAPGGSEAASAAPAPSGSAGSAGSSQRGETSTTEPGGGGNPATGAGPQSFAEGQPVNRPATIVRVQFVRRIAATCR